MSYVKLDERNQSKADESYSLEHKVIDYVDSLWAGLDSGEALRWTSIGRTHIEQGFMAMRKAITLQMKSEVKRELNKS